MKIIERLASIIKRINGSWIIALVLGYIIARGIIIDIPFLNLLVREFEIGMVLFWILVLLFWRFTFRTLIIISILFLFAYACSIIIRSGMDNDGLGIVIYLSLLAAFIKLFRESL